MATSILPSATAPTAAQQAENTAGAAARSDAVAAAVRHAIPDSAGLTLLDYGCGPGHVGLRLADDFGRIILADSDPEAARLATEAAAGSAKVEVRLLDLTQTLPDDLRADVVVSCLSWHHVTNLGALLEALPLVAPGGRLLVADMDEDGGAYHADHPEFAGIVGFDRTRLAATLTSHGYADVAVASLWQGRKWILGRQVPLSLFLLQAGIPDRAGREEDPGCQTTS